MARESLSATEPTDVSVYQRRGYAEVRLRSDIRQDTADMPDGTSVTFWSCDEASLVVPGRITEGEARARFDELWAEAEGVGDGDDVSAVLDALLFTE